MVPATEGVGVLRRPGERFHHFSSIDEQEALFRYLQRVDGAKDPEQACSSAMEVIAENTHFSCPSVYLLDRRSDSLRLAAFAGYIPSIATIRRGEGICGRALATGEIQLVEDVTLDADYIAGKEDTASELSIPLLWHGTLLGVLDVQSPKKRAFQKEDVRFLRLLAAVLGSVLSHLETEKQLTRNLERGSMFRKNLLSAQEALNLALENLVAQKRETEELVRVQRALIDISQMLFACRSAEELFPLILDVLHGDLGFECILLFGRENRKAPLALAAFQGHRLADGEIHELLVERKGILGYVLDSRLPYLCNDTRKDPRYVPDAFGTLSELVVPIVARGFLWGALVAISPLENAFTHRDQEVLVLVAGFMAVVLENIANMEMLSRELGHMRLLHDVVSEISLLRDRKRIAERVVDLLKKNFQYTHVTFFEIDGEDAGTCRTIATTGYSEKEFAFFDAERKRRGGGLVELAARTKTLRNTQDVRLCETYVPSINGTLSELDAPIMYGDRLLGVLAAESSHVGAFSREDEEVFYVLSRSLGATWAVNALLEELERQAFTDALTGIPNRRFLFRRMEAAQRALDEREGNFAIVMADVERFKDINDTFGHALGDEVLVSIARCFREKVGASGIVGRYGGDEFLLLFPGMTKEAAEAFVLRLDEACRALRFSEPALKARANFGIAVFPEDGPTLERVLREADRRMYATKEQA